MHLVRLLGWSAQKQNAAAGENEWKQPDVVMIEGWPGCNSVISMCSRLGIEPPAVPRGWLHHDPPPLVYYGVRRADSGKVVKPSELYSYKRNDVVVRRGDDWITGDAALALAKHAEKCAQEVTDAGLHIFTKTRYCPHLYYENYLPSWANSVLMCLPNTPETRAAAILAATLRANPLPIQRFRVPSAAVLARFVARIRAYEPSLVDLLYHFVGRRTVKLHQLARLTDAQQPALTRGFGGSWEARDQDSICAARGMVDCNELR